MFKKTTTRRLARFAALTAVCTVGLGAGSAQAAPKMIMYYSGDYASCGSVIDQQPRLDHSNIRAIDDATICLINVERFRHNLPKLSYNPQLLQAADRHANDMASHGQFPGINGDAVHTGTDGSRPPQRTADYWRGWSYFRVGENVAKGPGSQGTPRAAVQWWMASPLHKETMLNPEFRDVAVAARPRSDTPSSADGGTYTAVFGVRR